MPLFQISEAERTKSHAEELLGAEQEKSSLLEQECDSLRETRENLDKKLDQMQRRLHRVQFFILYVSAGLNFTFNIFSVI